MKLSKIALAGLLATGAVSSFAVTPLACKTSGTAAEFVNTCAPAVTFYVAGSSALGGAISKVITASSTTGATGYFDTTTVPLITVVDNGTKNGLLANPTQLPSTAAGNGVTAWMGMSKASLTGNTSKPILVVYNSYMGSAAGVSQVLAPIKSLATVPEADIVKVGPTGNTPGTCVAYDSSSATPVYAAGSTAAVGTASNKVVCTSHAVTQADLAISDVDVTELVALYPEAAKTSLAKFTRAPLAMQGFAVAVNNNFYKALQDAQIDAGILPGCTKGTGTTATYTEACQPNITRAQYASLVSKEGSIKSAADFIPGSTATLTLARRDTLSGTQASSDMFFLANSCNKLDAKSKINAHGGALTPLRGVDDKGVPLTNLPSGLVVNENVQTGGVENDLKLTSGYSIGVIALSKGAGTAYKFVKLDGASPNFAKGATSTLVAGVAATSTAAATASTLRNNMLDGSWPLQMTAYAVYPTAAAATYDAKKAPKAEFIKQMVSDLSSASLHDLDAIGYFNGPATKKTLVSRVGGNNCSPLVTRTN